MGRFKLMPKALTVIEGHPITPASDAAIVKNAWDFDDLNHRYEQVLQLVARCSELADEQKATQVEVRQWLNAERSAWVDAVSLDPLLPLPLLPSDYLGQQAWRERQKAYAALGRRVLRGGKTGAGAQIR